MKTAFVIQIVQLGQYIFFLELADFDPTKIGVPDSLDFTYVSMINGEALSLWSDEKK